MTTCPFPRPSCVQSDPISGDWPDVPGSSGIFPITGLHPLTSGPLSRPSAQLVVVLMTLLWVLVAIPRVEAQWVTQEIRLGPGFNPVFLQVTPADTSCESVFGGVSQVREVWLYNRYLQTSTFVSDSTAQLMGQDHWLTWYPAGSAKSFLNTLTQVRGGQAYLIRLPNDAAPTTIRIRGIPVPPRSDWIPNDVVLAGFPIHETDRVNFQQFLKDSPQVSAAPGQDSALFTVNPLTAFESQIRNPEATRIVPGRAYWAYLAGHSHNPYPFQALGPDENNSVQFRQDVTVAAMTLVNAIESGEQTLVVRLLESEEAPAGQPTRAGTVPLATLVPRADGGSVVTRLSGGLTVKLQPGERRTLRLGLIAAELAPSSDTNATYQALIEVTEKSHGYRQLVPVVAEVAGSRLSSRRGSLVGASRQAVRRVGAPADDGDPSVPAPPLHAGLWVGTLTLNAVNTPGFAQEAEPDTARFAVSKATPLNTRVMVHVDGSGAARLVPQVIFAEVASGTNRVTQMYSTLTNVPVGARIQSRVSAPSWPRGGATALAGDFGDTLSGTVSVGHDDAVNPFVHRYHPDHDNLGEDFQTPLPAGVESFSITRRVALHFGDTLQVGSGTFLPTVPAMRFSGAAGESVRVSGFTNTASFSAQFWLKVSTHSQSGAPLLLLTNTSSGAAVSLGFQGNTGTLVMTVRSESGTAGTVVTTNAVPKDAWCNVVMTYDASSGGTLYVNGRIAGLGYLPSVASGGWGNLWIGGGPGTTQPSIRGSIHDVVVRSGVLALQVVPQVALVPHLTDPGSILLDLQGNALGTNVVNRGSAVVTVTASAPGVVDMASAPAVPLWTYGNAQGVYQETVLGLRRQAITVQGTFQLTRVSPDPNLY